MTTLMMCFNSFGQGLILTKSGDTIRCSRIDYKSNSYWVEEVKYEIPKNTLEIFNIDYFLIENEIDKFTGFSKKTSKFNAIALSSKDADGYRKPFVVYMKKIISSDTAIFALCLRTSYNLGCSGANGNYVMIKFTNGDVITLEKDIAKIDCAKSSISIFVLGEMELYKIKNQEISSIRFKKSEYYEDFEILFPDYLIKTIKLLDE